MQLTGIVAAIAIVGALTAYIAAQALACTGRGGTPVVGIVQIVCVQPI